MEPSGRWVARIARKRLVVDEPEDLIGRVEDGRNFNLEGPDGRFRASCVGLVVVMVPRG